MAHIALGVQIEDTEAVRATVRRIAGATDCRPPGQLSRPPPTSRQRRTDGFGSCSTHRT